VRLNGGEVKYDTSAELINNSEYTLLLDFKNDPGAAIHSILQFYGQLLVESRRRWRGCSSHHGCEFQADASQNLGIDDGQWHRLALTFSSEDGTAILYLDGAEVARISGMEGAIQVGHPVAWTASGKSLGQRLHRPDRQSSVLQRGDER
jgi:hypothetical protein